MVHSMAFSCTLLFKSLWSVRFFTHFFESSLLCLPRLHLIDTNKVKTVILWNICTVSNKYYIINVIYSCDAKLNYLQSLLQFSVSHDPLDIIFVCWFAAQESFIIIHVENVIVSIHNQVVLVIIFLKTDTDFHNYLMNKKLKRTAFLYISKEMINVFTLTFHQFEVLNKNVYVNKITLNCIQ